jgi:ABC-type nickel/cobalt efflux system permease component RcnA
MKGMLALFISLAIGYVLCVLANKQQKGLLQTVGYTLGIAIIVMSLAYSAADSCEMACRKSKTWQGYKGMKCGSGMSMKGHIK